MCIRLNKPNEAYEQSLRKMEDFWEQAQNGLAESELAVTDAIVGKEAYVLAMARLDELFEIANRNKEQQREFDHIAKLIDAYEEQQWPLDGQ